MAEKRAPGRPIVREERADKQINFYVSENERDTIKAAAADAGESVGQWLAKLAMKAAKKQLGKR